MTTIQYTGELVVVTCWCGMAHAVPTGLRDYQMRCHRDGKAIPDIYCPLGHSHCPAGDGEAAQLRARLKREQERAARLVAERDQVEASLRAQKGATTRAKRRHAAALCPCCNRSFKQLRAHMNRMHPDYETAVT